MDVAEGLGFMIVHKRAPYGQSAQMHLISRFGREKFQLALLEVHENWL